MGGDGGLNQGSDLEEERERDLWNILEACNRMDSGRLSWAWCPDMELESLGSTDTIYYERETGGESGLDKVVNLVWTWCIEEVFGMFK